MTENYPVIFLGAGPGDPELITVKGRRALAAADVVLYAGSLVSDAMLGWAKPGAELIDTAPLDLGQIVAKIIEAHKAGKRVVRVHSGDTSLFSAMQEQLEILEQEDIPCQVIPGVTAAAAAAAALAQELTLPEVTQTVILTRAPGRTPVPEAEALGELAGHRATLVIYLSTKLIEKVVAELTPAYGPEAPVVVAYRVSWPDQRLIRGNLADIAAKIKDAGIERQALIMVSPALAARQGRLKAKSKLYDRTFSHGYRAGMDTEKIRQRYRPEIIRVLLIGESPPANGKFFYLHSPMTAFTSQAFAKAHGVTFQSNFEFLTYFKACGCYQDDLSHIPANHSGPGEWKRHRQEDIDALSQRLREANPAVVVITPKRIEAVVREAIRKSQCNPKVYVIPFPGHGHQSGYIDMLAAIITEHIPRR